MASVELHHQPAVRPAPSTAPPAAAVQFNNVVINLAAADDVPPSHSVGGGTDAAPGTTPVPSPLPSMRSLLMCCEGSLPFILIILAKLLYDHRLGMRC